MTAIMTARLTILGYDPDTLLPSSILPDSLPEVLIVTFRCTKGCVNPRLMSFVESTLTEAPSVEHYELAFSTGTAARQWIQTNATDLARKTLLLVDPAP